MLVAGISFAAETPCFDAVIEELHALSFGPGRFARAATRIREEGPHDRALSFVACRNEVLVGSVRLTPIAAGEGRAHLLGPLAVSPAFKSMGIGRHLMGLALEAAREQGVGLVLLVGDEPYYKQFGFTRVPYGQVVMPRPVDPARLLAHEIASGALARFRGAVTHAHRASALVPGSHL